MLPDLIILWRSSWGSLPFHVSWGTYQCHPYTQEREASWLDLNLSLYSVPPSTLPGPKLWGVHGANRDVPSLLGHTVGTRIPRTSCPNGSLLTWGSSCGPFSQSILLRVNCSTGYVPPRHESGQEVAVSGRRVARLACGWCVTCMHRRSPTMCARVVSKKGRGMGYG